tara:strand:+ start:1648 stop:1863 length:216 start_codon:yes stop_codon:yes gene_type:complete
MPVVKKVYPIEGRKDFFKYVILDNNDIFNKNAVIAKDFNKKEMYFDCKKQADRVCEARNKVKRINNEFLNS